MPETAFPQDTDVDEEIAVFMKQWFFAYPTLIDMVRITGNNASTESWHRNPFWRGFKGYGYSSHWAFTVAKSKIGKQGAWPRFSHLPDQAVHNRLCVCDRATWRES